MDYEEYDEPQYLAESLYHMDTLKEDQLLALARMRAKDEHKEILNQVEYVTYKFADGSKLTIGTNGYVGCETPAQRD